MSEYQYYEFQAIDRPLDEQAMADLRSITSRALITPTSLINVYHFGDFKGNPGRLMDQYFDAHLYVANWGSRRFMLRLAARALPLSSVKPYFVSDVLQARTKEEHVVLDFHSASEAGDVDFEEGEGWLASLIPLRSDLLAGDLRCLYLGWLAGWQDADADDPCLEPPVPPGLRQLSGPLRRFSDFLRLDPDLIEAAAAGSGEALPGGPSAEDLAAWLAALPQADKDSLLVRLMQGEGVSLAGELLRRFRKDQARRQGRAGRDKIAAAARRTVGDLIESRDRLAEDRKAREAKRAAKEQEQRAREQAAARARHLDSLAGQEEKLWRQVEAAITTRLPREYVRAVELLKDLRDLAERAGAGEAATDRIRELRTRHASKRTLVRRLDQAGLPQ